MNISGFQLSTPIHEQILAQNEYRGVNNKKRDSFALDVYALNHSEGIRRAEWSQERLLFNFFCPLFYK